MSNMEGAVWPPDVIRCIMRHFAEAHRAQHRYAVWMTSGAAHQALLDELRADTRAINDSIRAGRWGYARLGVRTVIDRIWKKRNNEGIQRRYLGKYTVAKALPVSDEDEYFQCWDEL